MERCKTKIFENPAVEISGANQLIPLLKTSAVKYTHFKANGISNLGTEGIWEDYAYGQCQSRVFMDFAFTKLQSVH